MNLELIHEGTSLPVHRHQGALYAEAPKSGAYKIRLKNDSPSRRLAVVSVDGCNVLDGKDASHDGAGYVLGPWESIEIPGWSRGDKAAAAFEFAEEKESYANKTGRGTKNIGVIGVAIFDEKVQKPPKTILPIVIERHIHHHDHDWPYRWPWPQIQPIWSSEPTLGGTICSTNNSPQMSMDSTPTRLTKSMAAKDVVDVGTAYGSEIAFHTQSTSFERATATPAAVLTLRYATRERLKKMGVDFSAKAEPSAPDAFPASTQIGVPAPPGWRG